MSRAREQLTWPGHMTRSHDRVTWPCHIIRSCKQVMLAGHMVRPREQVRGWVTWRLGCFCRWRSSESRSCRRAPPLTARSCWGWATFCRRNTWSRVCGRSCPPLRFAPRRRRPSCTRRTSPTSYWENLFESAAAKVSEMGLYARYSVIYINSIINS